MTSLFIDCPTGLAGDMLLAAFIDLGVPKAVIQRPLFEIGFEGSFTLNIQEKLSFGFRGLKASVLDLELANSPRRWKEIKELISNANWSELLIRNVYQVFETLAEAEAFVHGEDIDNVHFHEVGAIDSLVDIVGVCAAVEYLEPSQIFCSNPPAGRGSVSTLHGVLPVPAPAVLELARRSRVNLLGGDDHPSGELTTPTGLALMTVLADQFTQPPFFRIENVGIGLGERELDRPNFLRICSLHSDEGSKENPSNALFKFERIVVQEAWIDDQTPEDLTFLTDQLRESGALDVVCKQVHMKKGRQGVTITLLAKPEDAECLRLIWFSKSSTIGLRERFEGRYVLPRRNCSVQVSWGNVLVKQVRRPEGIVTFKPEHDDILNGHLITGKGLEELKLEVQKEIEKLVPQEDWGW